MSVNEDKSRGWNEVATQLIKGRALNRIGAEVISAWCRHFAAGSRMLEAGCGAGIPVTEILLKAGMEVFALDAAPALVTEFKHNFPGVAVRCEAVEDSDFYQQDYDAVLAVGLIFLLPEAMQLQVLARIAAVLRPGGRLLFTSPWQCCYFTDSLTGKLSCSLGREAYVEFLLEQGLQLEEELLDAGQNHYFGFVKTAVPER